MLFIRCLLAIDVGDLKPRCHYCSSWREGEKLIYVLQDKIFYVIITSKLMSSIRCVQYFSYGRYASLGPYFAVISSIFGFCSQCTLLGMCVGKEHKPDMKLNWYASLWCGANGWS
jgi:hypothetical protein